MSCRNKAILTSSPLCQQKRCIRKIVLEITNELLMASGSHDTVRVAARAPGQYHIYLKNVI